MNVFTWAWIGWGLAFAVIEGIALFNSTRGDTLSEHAWAWLGVGSFQRRYHTTDVCTVCGTKIARPPARNDDPTTITPPDRAADWVHVYGYNRDQHPVHYGQPGFVTPKWTLRVTRIVLISFMVWLLLHFVTGGWV